jgi:long-chain fatty acid transport protein
MRRWLPLVVVTLVAGRAFAGGFEIIEQSPTGTATAGAQTARADDPSAVYYNPAGLAYQRGFGLLAGANLLRNDVTVASSGASSPAFPTVSGTGTIGTPTVFLSQRLGPHFGVGVGVFSNFAEHLEYPSTWAGRFSGTFLDLTTTTINPSVAIRPVPWVSIGFGFVIVPSSLDLRHAYGAPEGTAHSALTATGLGANLGVLLVAIPRYLRFGASYRSSIDLDFSGEGLLDAPGVITRSDVTLTVPLPHNFGFGVASTPVEGLTLSADARVTLWSDLRSFSAEFSDPSASGGQSKTDRIDLEERDAFGVRVGAEYRALEERLRVRLGAGYDRTPVRRGWLGPLTPDNDRVIASAGVGWHQGPFGVDAGYSAQVLLSRTSSNPDPGSATYSGVRHVISLAVELRLEELGGRINLPEYKH